jgi:hypothetical protein
MLTKWYNSINITSIDQHYDGMTVSACVGGVAFVGVSIGAFAMYQCERFLTSLAGLFI